MTALLFSIPNLPQGVLELDYLCQAVRFFAKRSLIRQQSSYSTTIEETKTLNGKCFFGNPKSHLNDPSKSGHERLLYFLPPLI